MNRNAAQHILEGTNRVGSYLLRNYSKGGPDDLTVSVKLACIKVSSNYGEGEESRNLPLKSPYNYIIIF